MYHAPEPIPLGPDSLLWRWAGDRRMGMVGLAGGILQLMHPGLGAGVVDHSDFFNDPWDRIERSLPEIVGVVYDGPAAEETGRRIRAYHRSIKGTDHLGRPYSALRPETFWWAHATFQHMVEQVADRFDCHRLGTEEREQLYREGVEWYRRYGVSTKPVPEDRTAFGEVWDRYCDEVLEMTPAAERSVDMALHDKVVMPRTPAWTAPVQRELVTPLLRLTAIGGLPARVRRRFGIPWGVDDAVQLAALETAVKASWRFVPRSARWAPRAAEGWRREARARRAATTAAAA
jgi:uncharacterized protein (DUF2236 family)